jgi:hypothetical protein
MQARVTGEWDETLMLKNGWKKTEGNKVTTWSVKAKDYNGEWSFAVKVGPRKAVAQCWPVGKTCQIDRLSFAAGRAAIKDFERRGISGLLHLQEYYGVPIELKPVKLEDIFVGSYLTDPEVIATLERYGYLQLGSGENKVLIDFSKDKDGLPYYTGPELEMGAIKFLKMMNAIDDWPEYAACQYRTEQHMKKVLDVLKKQGESSRRLYLMWSTKVRPLNPPERQPPEPPRRGGYFLPTLSFMLSYVRSYIQSPSQRDTIAKHSLSPLAELQE